ncbi:hypothetical protein C9374_004052 [Naegleria lovaniensis]|uniref:Uncharacterized protein n=1 Tax=Naegleria lovaniensis TaxID=51637 RepID=A0AA88H4E2_NAELO|nr:uncharacterized protein C9374_004052 [Naegleria lovaniensis]KAG2394288.1 hypothetical protein C9374_004052 [Naegleria lovaniensis]
MLSNNTPNKRKNTFDDTIINISSDSNSDNYDYQTDIPTIEISSLQRNNATEEQGMIHEKAMNVGSSTPKRKSNITAQQDTPSKHGFNGENNGVFGRELRGNKTPNKKVGGFKESRQEEKSTVQQKGLLTPEKKRMKKSPVPLINLSSTDDDIEEETSYEEPQRVIRGGMSAEMKLENYGDYLKSLAMMIVHQKLLPKGWMKGPEKNSIWVWIGDRLDL